MSLSDAISCACDQPQCPRFHIHPFQKVSKKILDLVALFSLSMKIET